MRLLPLLSGAILVSLAHGIPQQRRHTRQTDESNGDVCMSKECILASASLFNNMNLNVKPCDNFYEFACGGFVENEVIPDDRGRISAFTPNSEEIYKRARHMMESFDSEWKSDRMAKNLYDSCMDQEKIEELGLEPIKDILKDLGGWPVLTHWWDDSKFSWYDYTIKSLEKGLGISYIMSHSVGQDVKNISYRVWKIDHPGLGLSREYLIKGFEDKDVQHYYNYMVESAKLMGSEKAEEEIKKEMKEALEFEIKLANASTSREKRRDPNSLYNPTTVGQLNSFLGGKLPGFPENFREYFNQLFKAGNTDIELKDDEKMIVQDPDYMKNIAPVLEGTDAKTIANYLGWRIYKSVVSDLNKAARDLRQEYIKALHGVAKASPDWKRCLGSVGFNTYSGGMVAVAGSMYVRHYFKPEEKKVVETMISYIRAAFDGMLDKVDWMDEITREKAKKKLKNMDQFIAYPDEVLDESIIEEFYGPLDAMSPETYLQNDLKLNKFSTARALKQLREKIDTKHWTEHYVVALVNAFYNPDVNSIEFPAGILQGAFYNSKLPEYMNFGAIGAVIGHEFTHGFDDQGRNQDFEGKLVDWWEESTTTEYKKRAQCVIDQYGNYTAEQIGMKLNGINTQGENIADNGGIKEAYLGYQNFVKDNGPPQRLPGHDYNQNQMFWISFGQVWCSKFKDGTLKSQILTGVHSPGEFRIKGSLSNNEDFAKDFNCPVGSKMNPKKKCTVW